MSIAELNKAVTYLGRLEHQLDNLEPFVAEVSQIALRIAKASFANQATPDGDQWAPLHPRTLRERHQKGYGPTPILVRKGSLQDSVRAVMNSPTSASVGTDAIQAGLLNFGWSGDKEVPARAFLGLPDSAESSVWAALERHIG